jgi:hypothetical protein
MAHFNTALNGQDTLAVGRAVARTTLRKSATASGSGRSRPQFTPVMWKSSSLAPQIQSAMAATSRSAITLTGLLQTDGPQVARLAAKVGFDLGHRRKAETRIQPWHFADLDLVHVVVATQQQQPDL